MDKQEKKFSKSGIKKRENDKVENFEFKYSFMGTIPSNLVIKSTIVFRELTVPLHDNEYVAKKLATPKTI